MSALISLVGAWAMLALHHVGRRGCNRLEPVNQSGLVQGTRAASLARAGRVITLRQGARIIHDSRRPRICLSVTQGRPPAGAFLCAPRRGPETQSRAGKP